MIVMNLWGMLIADKPKLENVSFKEEVKEYAINKESIQEKIKN